MDPIPEQELSVQVTNVDRVHVDDMNVFKARQCKVCKNLTAQAARANDQNLALVAQKALDLKTA